MFSFIAYPLFKFSIWFQGPATWEEFIGGDGFTGWIRYSKSTDNIDVGGIMQTLALSQLVKELDMKLHILMQPIKQALKYFLF